MVIGYVRLKLKIISRYWLVKVYNLPELFYLMPPKFTNSI